MRLKTAMITCCIVLDPWWHLSVHLYTRDYPKKAIFQRIWEASWFRSFQSCELEVVRHKWGRILPTWPLGIIPTSYLLEMRAYSYLWRDPNSVSQPICSSSPIPKWLVYVYLQPYAKIVPICYSFGLEKECLESLAWTWIFIQGEPINIKAWLYASLYFLLTHNCWFIFPKCVCSCIIYLNIPWSVK